MPGNVWKIEAAVGDRVAVGDTLIVLESMKMEIAVLVPAAGRIAVIVGRAGRPAPKDATLEVLRRIAAYDDRAV